jgi:hypothetical protein
MTSKNCINKLKRLGVYKQFKRNVGLRGSSIKRYRHSYDDDTIHTFLIFMLGAFIWSRTPEGYDFWSNISEK